VKILDTFSVRDAETILRQRDALAACRAVASRWSGTPKQNSALLLSLGFEPEWSFGAGGNRPRFDGYSEKWKVGIEREMREQMNVRSHLLFTEIAFQKGLIDVGVFILPMAGQGRFVRTVRETTEFEIFTRYFPLEVPLYLIGCER